MTCREMFDEIAADYQKIKIRISKMHPRVVKIFKRSKIHPPTHPPKMPKMRFLMKP